MSASSYGVGNRVYRSGSSAPTIGTVDPMGYIERELNKVATSTTRSGLAAAALRRMGSTPTGSEDPNAAPTTQPGQVSAYGAPSATAISGQAKGISTPSPTAGGSPLLPLLRVNPVGKLSAEDLQTKIAGMALPFDPEAASARSDLLATKNQFDSEFTKGNQDLERDYTLKQRDMGIERPNNERNLLENYAGRGLAYSSGYANDQTELQNTYARMASDLDQSRATGHADLIRQQGLFNDSYGNKLQAVEAAASRKAATQAAELAATEKAKNDAAGQALADQQAAIAQQQGLAQQQGDTFVAPGAMTGVTTGGDLAYRLGSGQAPAPRNYIDETASLPSNQYQSPAPMPTTAPSLTQGATWTNPDAGSLRALQQGSQVTRGNGYVYAMQNGQIVRIA